MFSSSSGRDGLSPGAFSSELSAVLSPLTLVVLDHRKHYIPLSSAYSELYNVQSFFSGIPEAFTTNASRPVTVLTKPSPLPELPTNNDGTPFNGDVALREIAEAGTEWRKRHVRREDMEVSRWLTYSKFAR